MFRVYRQVKNVATVSPATRDEAMEALTAAVAPRTSTICARWIDDGDMTALEDLKSMVPHLRAIATWALESGRIGDAVLALRRLYTWVCSGRGHPEQLRLWVLRCLAEGVEGVDRARLLLAAAGLESMAGQKDASRAHLEEALSLETSPELRHRILVMHARTLPIEQGITQLRQLLELPMRPDTSCAGWVRSRDDSGSG